MTLLFGFFVAICRFASDRSDPHLLPVVSRISTFLARLRLNPRQCPFMARSAHSTWFPGRQGLRASSRSQLPEIKSALRVKLPFVRVFETTVNSPNRPFVGPRHVALPSSEPAVRCRCVQTSTIKTGSREKPPFVCAFPDDRF